MDILLLHQNFPGQFVHLAPALVARGHRVLALTDAANKRSSQIRTVRYRTPEVPVLSLPAGSEYAKHAQRGISVALAARSLRDKHGYNPDVILGHSGWGEPLFLREIWPDARLLTYAELMYRTKGEDIGFDPEFGAAEEGARIGALTRSAHLLQGLIQCDAAMSPTHYQASSFPAELQGKITVMHDGIDTDRLAPDPDASFRLPDGRSLTRKDEVVSYVSRSLEPYRGFHVFMRSLPQIMASRPQAQIVVVGSEGVSYGAPPPDGESWKKLLLQELDGRLDLSRLHFTGRVAFADYVSLLKISSCHVYLTYPFVLSWSLTEAMAAGCRIVASDTAPVRELVENGVHGRLVPFFDIAAISDAVCAVLSERDAGAGTGTGEKSGKSGQMAANARRRILDGYDLRRICLPRQIEWIEAQARQAAVITGP